MMPLMIIGIIISGAHASYDARMMVLSQADVTRYQDIFDLQEAGKLKQAGKIITALDDPLLMGHVFHN